MRKIGPYMRYRARMGGCPYKPVSVLVFLNKTKHYII